MSKRGVALWMLASLMASAAQAHDIAITNARIITLGPGGDIASGAIVVHDGKIVSVGRQVAIPPGAVVIDAKGQFVTPGLMMTMTTLGLRDVLKGPPKASSSPRLSAAYELAADINPRQPQIPEAREEGVTQALVVPASGGAGQLFAGQATLIRLAEQGGDNLDPHAALVVDATDSGAQAAAGGVGGVIVRLRQALADARAFQREGEHFDLARLGDTGLSRADLSALAPVLARHEPLLVQVDRAEALQAFLALARDEHIALILAGAAEGWRVADDIARAGVPVILDGEANQAGGFDTLNASYQNAALLRRSGVAIAFQPPIFSLRTPRFVAGRATRFGLGLHDALAAITLNPARMFGSGSKTGSLEVGKDADLVVWSGDPFETSTVARQVIIGGVVQTQPSRSRLLLGRYLPSLGARPRRPDTTP